MVEPRDQSPRDRPPREALVCDAVGRGSRVAALRHLPGGSFHANHAIDVVDHEGGIHQLVLRRWARPGWEETDGEFDAHREAAILRLLARSTVPAPQLLAADPLGERCGVPALLTTRLHGEPTGRPAELHSFLVELAAAIAAIHSVDDDARKLIPPYRRYYEPEQLKVPSWAERPAVWRRAIAAASEAPSPGRDSFIHRDFHPGNTLWSNGRLTGVVDWSYGSWVPAAIDLAHLRWNLAVDFGLGAAEQVLVAHRAVTGGSSDHDPYWDVVDALDPVCDLDPAHLPPREELARLEDYVAGVLGAL